MPAPTFSPLMASIVASVDVGSPLFINRRDPIFGLTQSVGTSSAFSLGLGPSFDYRFDPVWTFGSEVQAIYTRGHFSSDSTITGNDLSARVKPFVTYHAGELGVSAGPWIATRFSHRIFENGRDVTALTTESAATHFGIGFGLTWEAMPVHLGLRTNLDLTELDSARGNAWNVGFVFTIPLMHQTELPADTALVHETAITPQAPVPEIHFLVSSKRVSGPVSLDEIELYRKEYEMVDSPDVAPRVRQWISKSYHIPHLEIETRGAPSGSPFMISVLEGSTPKVLRRFDASGLTDLDQDELWQRTVSDLSIYHENVLVAELQTSARAIARDTLRLLKVDTTRSTPIVRHETRFILSTNFDRIAGQSEAFELLLDRIRSVAQSSRKITLFVPYEKMESGDVMLRRVIDALEGAAIEQEVSKDPLRMILYIGD